jgi:predicted ATP-dependent endonuclease of OLD family
MFIDGIGISNYRSFGPETQRIGPFGKMNLIIGQNNSGKSNILLFLKDYYGPVLKRQNYSFKELDYHKGNKTATKGVEIGLKIGSDIYNKIIARLGDRRQHLPNIDEIILKVLQSHAVTKETEMAWFRCANDSSRDTEVIMKIYTEKIMPYNSWVSLHHILTGANFSGGSMEAITKECIFEILNWLSPCNFEPPQIDHIPAIRSIGEKGEFNQNDFSGRGIIERLAMLQNAPYDKPEDKVRFKKINEFTQSVLCNNSAILHVPYAKDTIEVQINDRNLPLSNLGMGVHEIIILAAAATILEKQVVCIEEPELHCHPLLQKQLLKYLNDKTENQYFISTHSAHLLDTPDASIFHVQLCNGESKVNNIINDSQKVGICDDLGYRASDLLQANCVIWVEGPSDRIYLNHWIHSKATELIEGLHYSIMFYGGRLLSHLTASDSSEVNDFISLRRLNQHTVIVIDSDKSGADQRISDTKERIRNEFDKVPGFAWVTQGREIENYIAIDVLEKAAKTVHASIESLAKKGDYDNRLKLAIVGEAEKEFDMDKVKIAKEVAKSAAGFGVLDLEEQVQKIVKFIRDSNGMVVG